LIALREIVRILKPGGQGLVTVWAKEQEVENKKSTYISKHVNPSISTNCSNDKGTDELIIHTPRTEFQRSDCLVPWAKATEKYLRYYHVFVKDELENLLKHISQIEIVNSYNDDGNWCVIFKKII
jgi:alkylated DNA repair protein alkB family protein 8